MALVAVVIGVAIAIVKYRSEVPRVAPTNVRFFTKIARRDLLQDDFNEVVLMRPGQALTKFLVELIAHSYGQNRFGSFEFLLNFQSPLHQRF